MQLYVKLLNGTIITISAESRDTVEDIKTLIEQQTGIPGASQRLIFAGK